MAKRELDNLKFEVAKELGIDYRNVDKGALPARVNGQVGGLMVRRMIQLAEKYLGEAQGRE